MLYLDVTIAYGRIHHFSWQIRSHSQQGIWNTAENTGVCDWIIAFCWRLGIPLSRNSCIQLPFYLVKFAFQKVVVGGDDTLNDISRNTHLRCHTGAAFTLLQRILENVSLLFCQNKLDVPYWQTNAVTYMLIVTHRFGAVVLRKHFVFTHFFIDVEK